MISLFYCERPRKRYKTIERPRKKYKTIERPRKKYKTIERPRKRYKYGLYVFNDHPLSPW